MPVKIEELETEQADINRKLADTDIYKNQPDLVKTLHARLLAIDADIEAALAFWELLEAKK